jgi:hypothetical protein
MNNELVKKTDKEELFDIFNQPEERADITELPTIKIIHAAQLFEMPDGSTKNEIQCVLLHTYKQNAYWENVDINNQMPDCWAIDYKKGEMKPDAFIEVPQSEECRTCKLNQFGTDTKGGAGKACKNMRVLFIYVEGYCVPCKLSVPPTSLKSVDRYISSFLARQVPYQSVMTRLTLEKVDTYSVLKLSTKGVIETDKNKLLSLKNLIDENKPLMYRKPLLEEYMVHTAEDMTT